MSSEAVVVPQAGILFPRLSPHTRTGDSIGFVVIMARIESIMKRKVKAQQLQLC